MKNITLVLLLSVFVFSRKSNQEQNKQEESSGQRPSSTQLISDLDSNEDRKLSKGEVEGQLADDFSNIDTDKDGFLAESELDKAPKPQRGEGNGPPQQASTNKDLSSEINTSVKVIPVNTDYFIVQKLFKEFKNKR